MRQRVAILGAGRSGISAARAAIAAGDSPVVVDQGLPNPNVATELAELGVSYVPSFEGPFDRGDWDLLVTSPGVPMSSPLLLGAQAVGIPVIGEVEYAYRLAKSPMIAITGTNGKSTTTVMTYLAAKAAGLDPVLCGNIYGSGYMEMPLTEAAISASAARTLIAEVSSYQLEWVDTFHPKVGCITRIFPDHLVRYDGSFEAYAAAKMRIWENFDDDDTAVMLQGDPVVKPPTKGKVWCVGDQGEVRITQGQIDFQGSVVSTETLPFQEPHNFLNAGMAFLMVRAMNADTPAEQIIAALRTFKGLLHRMEWVGSKHGVTVINNSMCTNIDAVIQSSKSLNGPGHLLVGGRNKGLDFGPLGEYLRATGTKAYLFGTSENEINEMMGGGYPTFKILDAAFAAACSAAKEGDTILLAPGAESTDQFADFRDRGDVFKKIAKEWLEK